MCFKNVSWLYSGLKELSSVASSLVSFMSIVILSSHCDALDPKASTPIKNPALLESILDDMTHVLGEWKLPLQHAG